MESTRRITVGLGQLDLDEYNPRHEPVQAERDAISILVADERTLPLAKHIAKHGALNPFQNIGVLPHPTLARRYIVVEGNRRVAALKMLNDPTKAPDDETRRVIERARANGTIPGGRVEVVLCSGEEEAHLWKTVQHQGQQGGIGTRQWNSKQKTRNAQALGKSHPNAQSEQLLAYAKDRGLLPENDLDAIKITTITRFLKNAALRSQMGIASRPDALEIHVDQSQFDRVATQFLKDSIGRGAKVNSRANAPEIETYAAGLKAGGFAPATYVDEPYSPRASRAASKSPARRRAQPHPADRAKVVPPIFVPHFKDNRLARLFVELRSIDADQFPYAAAYLYRAFLETLIKRFAIKKGTPVSGDLDAWMKGVYQHLLNDAALIATHGKSSLKNRLHPFYLAAYQQDHRNSAKYLGTLVHGAVLPTKADLITNWDDLDFLWPLLVEGL
ncbi:hypothetical protein [Pseudoxanthomonas sp. JBR18]|uniref:hypothetical protein n=1 Tax=Pseudoxanthomonas sp. JBR18 TaxID=2969308 RepID=UPI00230688A2|nr:hypothetical protein [Pseudoxanthomonas sp. JBR18]WCE03551.1 hypothetical protein PJ250_15860 [Pseudoxanthomonas sp. JBR18]